jgi:hypothetical protein
LTFAYHSASPTPEVCLNPRRKPAPLIPNPLALWRAKSQLPTPVSNPPNPID